MPHSKLTCKDWNSNRIIAVSIFSLPKEVGMNLGRSSFKREKIMSLNPKEVFGKDIQEEYCPITWIYKEAFISKNYDISDNKYFYLLLWMTALTSHVYLSFSSTFLSTLVKLCILMGPCPILKKKFWNAGLLKDLI